MVTPNRVRPQDAPSPFDYAPMSFFLVMFPVVLTPVWVGVLWYFFGPLLAVISVAAFFLIGRVSDVAKALDDFSWVSVLTLSLPIWVAALAHYFSPTAAIGVITAFTGVWLLHSQFRARLCPMLGHAWDGCICTRCGESRHDWGACTCRRCRTTRDAEHDWDDHCICRQCHTRRHDWQNATCVRCGRTKCESCSGTGCRVCTGCGGRGGWEGSTFTDGMESHPVTCGSCDGSGKEPCPGCNATGAITLSAQGV